MHQSLRNKKDIREKFVAFLEARNASRAMLDATSVIPPLGQIEVPDGVIFSQREIIKRNEFLDGEHIVIGAQTDYSPLLLNVMEGNVFSVSAEIAEDNESISREATTVKHVPLHDYINPSIQTLQTASSDYAVPRKFNIDAVTVMCALSDAGIGMCASPDSDFTAWLMRSGVDASFPYYKCAPFQELSAGCCTLFDWQSVMKFNQTYRLVQNPHFRVLGTCPDGNLVVIEIQDNCADYPVGYVAYEEVGDDGDWMPYYVRIASSIGAFLHDSNFLNYLPDDYYQAKQLGY